MTERNFEKPPYMTYRGIERYRAALSEGTTEIVEREGAKFLRIYRGLRVPERQTYSEGDNVLRTPGKIDINTPGTDWSPNYAFAKGYAGRGSSERWCILSALAPLDNKAILSATIHDNKTLGEDDWGDFEEREIQQISDALMVTVPPDCYKDLKEITIQECFGDFSK